MDSTIIFDDGNENNPMTEEQRHKVFNVVQAKIKSRGGKIKKKGEYSLHISYGDSLLALDELNDFSEQSRDDLLKEIERRIIKGITKALKKQKEIIYTAESQEPSWVSIPVQAKPDLDPDYFKVKVTC